MNKNWKNKAWKIATAIIVAIIIINPEIAELALFIDAVGLEMFFTLLEVQLLLTLGVFYNKIKMIFAYLKELFKVKFSWKNYQRNPQNLLLIVPTPAMLMHLLVFSVIIGYQFKLG